MGSVRALTPKPPRKDLAKLGSQDEKVLCFTAQYANPKAEDTDRIFVVNYHLADDTLSIHEPPQRNLDKGRLLGKGVHQAVANVNNVIAPKDWRCFIFDPGGPVH